MTSRSLRGGRVVHLERSIVVPPFFCLENISKRQTTRQQDRRVTCHPWIRFPKVPGWWMDLWKREAEVRQEGRIWASSQGGVHSSFPDTRRAAAAASEDPSALQWGHFLHQTYIWKCERAQGSMIPFFQKVAMRTLNKDLDLFPRNSTTTSAPWRNNYFLL